MSDMNEIANAFYGSSTPTKPAVEPQRSADQDTADVLFGKTTSKPTAPPAVQGQAKDVDVNNDEQLARAMFTGSPIHGDALRQIEAGARELLVAPEEAQAIAKSWEPTLHSFELNATESAQVTELAVSVSLNPPDQETVQAWQGDAMSALRSEYGPRAGEALQLARQLVARDPAAFDLLHRTGLGNHPHIVRTAAARAMAMKKAGKL